MIFRLIIRVFLGYIVIFRKEVEKVLDNKPQFEGKIDPPRGPPGGRLIILRFLAIFV